MRTYSDELKASLVERMLLPENASVPRLSRETGIPRDTLYGWRRQAWRERGLASAPLANTAERWRSEEKFAMVGETAALTEAQLGEYCRKRGVYPEEIKAWRLACERANDGGAVQRSPGRAEAQANKRRMRELEGELGRKEKALAEAAALVVLRTKAQAILKGKARPYDQRPGSPPGGRADPRGLKVRGAAEAGVRGVGH